MSDHRLVKIKHSKLGEGEVAPSSLPVWEERGWSAVDDENTGRKPARKSSASRKRDSSRRRNPGNATASSHRGDSTSPAESA